MNTKSSRVYLTKELNNKLNKEWLALNIEYSVSKSKIISEALRMYFMLSEQDRRKSLLESIKKEKTIPIDHPHVYIMQDQETQNIKIGVSTNPESRKQELEREYKIQLKILRIFPFAGYEVEKAIHSRFNFIRVNKMPGNEWFKPTTELLTFIEDAEKINLTN